MSDWLTAFRKKRAAAIAIADPTNAPPLEQPPVQDYPLAPTRALTLNLRPYQVEGVQFLRDTKRAILGDAPGLGKTLQSCEAAELPCVISCPLSLVGQWHDFIVEQYPTDTVTVAAYGDVIKRDTALKEFEAKGGWLIVNHDVWRTFAIPIAKTLIVDEYHHMRNRSAKRSIGLKVYARKVERVYGLTATPVFKDLGDLWHLLHILDASTWGSYWSFIQRYAVTDSSSYGTRIIRMRSPKRLEADTKPYILARTYRDVGMYLPERIDKHVTLNLKGDELKRYRTLRDYYRLEAEGEDEATRFVNAGAVLHALRQLTITREKIEAIQQIIDDTPGEAPIIVFCWYRATAKVLADALNAAEITGAVDSDERRHLAHGADGQRVRVATMESLSEGIDLSYARTVIYAEETYVPGQQYQSLSRVLRHRTAEDMTPEELAEPVVAYWVRYLGTVDNVVHNTVRTRSTGNALTVLREALGL